MKERLGPVEAGHTYNADYVLRAVTPSDEIKVGDVVYLYRGFWHKRWFQARVVAERDGWFDAETPDGIFKWTIRRNTGRADRRWESNTRGDRTYAGIAQDVARLLCPDYPVVGDFEDLRSFHQALDKYLEARPGLADKLEQVAALVHQYGLRQETKS